MNINSIFLTEMAQADITPQVLNLLRQNKPEEAVKAYKGKSSGIARTTATLAGSHPELKFETLRDFAKAIYPKISKENIEKIRTALESGKTPTQETRERTKTTKAAKAGDIESLYSKSKQLKSTLGVLLSKKRVDLKNIESNSSDGRALLKKDPDAKKDAEKRIAKYEDALDKINSFLKIDRKKYEEEFANLDRQEKKRIMDLRNDVKKVIDTYYEETADFKKGSRVGPEEAKLAGAAFQDMQDFKTAEDYTKTGGKKSPSKEEFEALKRLMKLMYRPTFDMTKSSRMRTHDSQRAAFPLETKQEVRKYAKKHEKLKEYNKKLSKMKDPEDISFAEYSDIFDSLQDLYDSLKESIITKEQILERIN